MEAYFSKEENSCRYCGAYWPYVQMKHQVCSDYACKDKWRGSEEYRMLQIADQCERQMAKNLRLARAETRICESCKNEIWPSGNGHETNCQTTEAASYIIRQGEIYHGNY